MSKIICFANNKGGVGKTTTVATLAHIWASRGKSILLIDLDSQANLTLIMNCPHPSPDDDSSYTMLTEGRVNPVHLDIYNRLDMIPANLALSKIDINLAAESGREFRLADALEQVRDNYDYILIDCPPNLGLMTFNALIASDYLVMPATADELSYVGLGMVAELAGRVQASKRMNPNLQFLGVIITKYKSSFSVQKNYVNLIKRDVGELFVDTMIRDRTDVAKAVALHKSIVEYRPNSDAALDYISVAETLESRIK